MYFDKFSVPLIFFCVCFQIAKLKLARRSGYNLRNDVCIAVYEQL